jgi:hypothetical protein
MITLRKLSNYFSKLNCKHIADDRETWEYVWEGNNFVGYSICRVCRKRFKASINGEVIK